MDFAEAIQLPTSRSFWNSHDPALDHPFDETLLPTMAPLEGSNCSSTFLFPSTSSACDTGGESPAFKRPFQQSIFEENINLEGGAAESKATAQTYCTIAPAGSMDSSQFSWLAAPHHHAQGVCASQAQLLDQSPANAPLNHQVPCFFGALNSSSPVGSATSSAPDFGHGSGYPSFSKPLMRQPSTFCRPNSSLHPVTKQLNAKASWQSAMAQTNATSFNHKQLSPKEGPLDSPCSVVSGFTKLLQRAEPAFPDFEMESFGPSTSAGQDKALRFVHSQDPLISREAGSAHVTQSLSGIHDVRPCKRKRSKGPKQGDEVESQRRTHIAVERNRRKQMNEHLAALRALMPGSYVQKGDQASIVGGAIEFVKELEHLLNCLQSQKRRRAYSDLSTTPTSRPAMPSLDQLCPIAQQPFSFHSPQRVVDQSPLLLGSSTDSLAGGNITRHPPTSSGMMYSGNQRPVPSIPVMAGPATATTMGVAEMVGEAKSEMASVEVKRVGAEQVLVNIMAPRRSGQLLRTVVALESLALIVMHTNITTVRHTVLYSFHVQLELSCRMNVDELAVALHHSFTSLHSLQF